MGNVNAAGIWTPDHDDNLDPEVWSAAMGDSIMNGLGLRMIKQETKVGAKISIAAPASITAGGGDQLFELTVSTAYEYSHRNFIEGIDLAGGVLEVTTAGLYLIASSVIADVDAEAAALDMAIKINADIAAVETLSTSTTVFTSKTMLSIDYLEVGDAISLGADVGLGFTGPIDVVAAQLLATLIYAT